MFFYTCIMLKFFSATKLVILPKVSHPQTASDFKPISCCIVFSKCISKLLTNRIKCVLSHLINECQRIFVQNIELLYNVLICQDITRGYKRANISPRFIMKIDLHKESDSIH